MNRLALRVVGTLDEALINPDGELFVELSICNLSLAKCTICVYASGDSLASTVTTDLHGFLASLPDCINLALLLARGKVILARGEVIIAFAEFSLELFDLLVTGLLVCLTALATFI
ncbi:hypothetical protein N7493_001749 [Penicillium malachiteum]|uniref:Uncharacterized protein n=1 Tax=Penicillium malachiteum TaxID=1324776 RepID=A0AAD6HVB8_9EURO|nr:hypothetical protein N7493_001749 [Penicillium malachiteum]